MANPTILSQFAMPDPDASPLNLTQLFQLANVLIRSTIQGDDFLNYVISSVEPAPEHRDVLWVQTDGVGRPIAMKVWWTNNGHWRRVYNGMIGEIRGYTGAPGLGPPPALFNANGRGNIGLEYDGWHICNGKDGVIDLSDKFCIGAHMNNSDSHTGYNNGWQTFVDGKSDLKTGGSKATLIEAKHLPPMDNSIPNNPDTGKEETPGLWLHGKGWKDDPATAHPDPVAIVDVNYGGMRDHAVKIVEYGSNKTNAPDGQVPLPVLPPFYALAWITFVGYENV